MFTTAETDFNIDRHLVKLLEESPFFAELSRHVRKVITNDLPTAGVTFDKHTDDFVLGVNPEFFSTMTDAQIAGVLRHEFYHIVFFHVTSRRRKPHMRWNVATDLAINSIILDKSTGKNVDLPECALVPGRPLSLTGKSKEHKAAQALSDLIATFPQLESSEYYWNRLSQLAEELADGCPVHGKGGDSGRGGKGEEPDPGEDKDKGEGGDQDDDHDDGDGHSHGHSDTGEDECTCGAGGFDDHAGWDEIPEDVREYAEAKARQLTEKAAKHADSHSNGWGSIPTSVRDEIRRMVSRTVDWKALLRQFVGSINRGERTTSVRRINRKYPYIHPGVKRGYTAKLAIAIDQSGSVSTEMLTEFFAELDVLTKKVSITIIPFDYTVAEDAIYEWKRGTKPPMKRVRGGGTDFNAPTMYVNDPKNRGRWDGMLIMTDGECSPPVASRIKRGWVLGAGHKLGFSTSEVQVTMDKSTAAKGSWR